MTTIRGALVDHLAQAGISYRQGEDSSVVIAVFEMHSGDAMLVCSCQEETYQLLLRVLFPFRASPQHQSRVAEFINRVNYGLNLGCFEMDYSDGELSFRIGIDVDGDRLTPALVRNLIGCALTASDYFYTSLAEVAVGRLTPIGALDMARG